MYKNNDKYMSKLRRLFKNKLSSVQYYKHQMLILYFVKMGTFNINKPVFKMRDRGYNFKVI